MTLSERHIKAYNDDVPAEPAPHKDRFASQVSMGLSITIPENSYLVLYPWTDRGRTPFNISTHMRKELPLEERPENIVKGAERVEIHDTAATSSCSRAPRSGTCATTRPTRATCT